MVHYSMGFPTELIIKKRSYIPIMTRGIVFESVQNSKLPGPELKSKPSKSTSKSPVCI